MGKARLGCDESNRRLRQATLDLFEAYGVPVTAARTAWLQTLDEQELDNLRQSLKTDRAWKTPEGD